MVVVEGARWPGFSFNAQAVDVCRYAMCRDMVRGFCSSLGVEVDV